METIASPISIRCRAGRPSQSTVGRHLNRFGRSARVLVLLLLAFCALASAQRTSLDGEWHFTTDPSASLSIEKLASVHAPRIAHVPSGWQAEFPDLRDYAGVAWYWRTINAKPVPKNASVLLHFGAVDYQTTVFVNGQRAGTHEGGYLPFEIDTTKLWRLGLNTIVLRVVDPGAEPSVVEGIAYDEIPHGKQNWYVQTSGPWQSIALDYRPAARILSTHVTARGDGNFAISLQTTGATNSQLHFRIFDSSGGEIWRGEQRVGNDGASIEARVSGVKAWSPTEPILYTLRAQLDTGDIATTRFGFRTLEAREGKLYLNGQPFYLRGALDQDFYPDTIYSVPSADYVKDEMRKAKALGLNALRFHIKAADPRYLDAADEIGVLIWYDLPNWDRLTPAAMRRATDTLHGMIDRDWNHPCIGIYTVINEAWGVDIKSAADRQWMKQAWQDAKRSVPGWLVVDNSPCCDDYHLKTDIADFHQYNAIPDFADTFAQMMDEFATRPKWLFSQNGDAESTGREPLILSEFGNWGLPAVPAQRPWWFGRKFKNNEITLPEGYEQRFAAFGLASVFQSLQQMVQQTELHEWLSLKYEIDTLRAHSDIQGYVITEFTDINWETNGLLDMWRRAKVFAGDLAKLQKDDAVVVRARRRNYITGDRIAAEVLVSHYSGTAWDDARLHWSLEGSNLSGDLHLGSLPVGSGKSAGWIDLSAPPVTVPERRKLQVSVMLAGKVLCENWLDVFFYPRNIPDGPPPIRFYDPHHELVRLQHSMALRNYHSAADASPAIVIASKMDAPLQRELEHGTNVLLLTGEKTSIAPGVEVVPRANSNLDGNWISGFLWVRQASPAFHSVGFDPLAGFEAEVAAPRAVITGVPSGAFSDVLSGIFYGWVHSSVATLVQGQYGKGKLIVCTFGLADAYGSDPYATYLLDDLLTYAASNFSPKLDYLHLAQPAGEQ
jgi:hypothetical protein